LMPRVSVAVVAAATLLAATAFADDKAACLDAAAKGQRFRDDHKLVEARDQLRICAAATCPAVVQSDCANFLADVEKTLPTVVVTAKNGAGVALADVKVTVDGRPLVSRLDGQAVAMDGGPHAFHFEGADGTLDQQVIINEGEKNQEVAVVLGAPTALSTDSGSSWSTQKTLAIVAGGVGIVGIGLGTVMGLVASSKWSSAQSDCGNGCGPNAPAQGEKSDASTFATVSTVGFVVGGVGLVGAAALWFTAPSGSSALVTGSGTGVEVVPMLGAGNGGLIVKGAF
jgi:hypothetical protein